MKLIPSDKIELYTSLSNIEVKKILRENISPTRENKHSYTKSRNDKIFEGKIASNRFDIQKMVHTRNSFLPQIKGTIKEELGGTKITMYLELHIFVQVFIGFFLIIASLILILTIIGILTQGANVVDFVIPLIVLTGGIAIPNFGYNIDKEKSINDLKKILNA